MALIKNRSQAAGHGERRYRDRGKEELLEQLREPNPVARRWAARDLAEYPETAPLLCDRLEREEDRSVRDAMLATLLGMRSVEVSRRLAALLASEDAALRAEVGDVLAQMPEEVASMVGDLLEHDDSDVRILGVTTVANLAHPSVPAWLARAIERDAHPNVVAAALEGLARCGAPDLIPVLEKARERFAHDAYVRFLVDATMERIRRRP